MLPANACSASGDLVKRIFAPNEVSPMPAAILPVRSLRHQADQRNQHRELHARPHSDVEFHVGRRLPQRGPRPDRSRST